MKLLVMCEGPNELEIMKILLRHRCLKFTNDDLLKEFDKVKSKKKPKQFAKEKIKCNRKRYDNSSKFYAEYFDGNVQLLVDSIREYKRVRGTHKKDELYLADLLREDMEFCKED